MATNIINLDEIQVATIKKRLRSKMRPTNNQDVVDYAMEIAVNCITYLDEDTLFIVEPTKKDPCLRK